MANITLSFIPDSQADSLVKELDTAVKFYRLRALAETTKRSYRTHLLSYTTFCAQAKLTPAPADTRTLCRYAAYLARRLSYQSIPKYLNILRIMHLELGLPNPCLDNWALDTVLKGIKRDKGASPKRKLPITPRILLAMRSHLQLSRPQDILFWATCITAFYGLFRKSNLVPASAASFDGHKHLTRGDLARHHQGLSLRVKWSKTIQFSERTYLIPLPYLGDHPLCPVTAVVNLLQLNPDPAPQLPLFSYRPLFAAAAAAAAAAAWITHGKFAPMEITSPRQLKD